MSILIEGMKAPTKCLKCPMYDDYNYSCKLCSFKIPARYNYEDTIRPEWCPLVELPDHHGPLIDADTLEPDADYDDGEFWAYSVTQVCNAQTIVEAE